MSVFQVQGQPVVYLGSGNQIHLSSTFVVPGNLVNAAMVTINSGELLFSGNSYSNLAGAGYAGAGFVTFAAPASGSQTLEGGGLFFNNLRISNPSNVSLTGGSDVGILETLEFTSGRLQLGDHNLHIDNGGIISGNTTDRYVITNGTGSMGYLSTPAHASLFFPVGRSGGTDYSPAFVRNGASVQDIRMRVQQVAGSGVSTDTAQGVRRLWNLWTDQGAALDSFVLYHHDSLNGSQYDLTAATVMRYAGGSWLKPCPVAADVLAGGLRQLSAHDLVLSNTATTSGGNAYYSKNSGVEHPALTLPSFNVAVCVGGGTAALPFSAVSGAADYYSLSWDLTASAAGFATVVQNTLPSDTIRIQVPSAATPGTYNGMLTVRSSTTECVSTTYNITVTVNPLPQPVVSWNGEILSTGAGYASYQWYRGSQVVAGGTSSTYRPLIDGSYAVGVTDSNGCSNISSFVTADHVAVGSLSRDEPSVSIYPNPSAGFIHVDAPIQVDIHVRGMDGRLLMEWSGGINVDISGFASGVYMIQVREQASGRLLKSERVWKY